MALYFWSLIQSSKYATFQFRMNPLMQFLTLITSLSSLFLHSFSTLSTFTLVSSINDLSRNSTALATFFSLFGHPGRKYFRPKH